MSRTCHATISISGMPLGCDADHDPHSGDPEGAQHSHDLANWQVRWDDWHCGHTTGAPLGGPSVHAEP